jgi:hypothetical protein
MRQERLGSGDACAARIGTPNDADLCPLQAAAFAAGISIVIIAPTTSLQTDPNSKGAHYDVSKHAVHCVHEGYQQLQGSAP